MDLYTLRIGNEKQLIKFNCYTKLTHVTLDADIHEEIRTSLFINNVLLCNLDQKTSPNVQVDIVFSAGDEIELQSSNKNNIYITGNSINIMKPTKDTNIDTSTIIDFTTIEKHIKSCATTHDGKNKKTNIINNMIKTTEIQVNDSIDTLKNNKILKNNKNIKNENSELIHNTIIHEVNARSRFCFAKDVNFCIANKVTNNDSKTTLSTIINKKNVKICSFINNISTQKVNYWYKANEVCTFEIDGNNVVNLVGVVVNDKKRKNKEASTTKRYKNDNDQEIVKNENKKDNTIDNIKDDIIDSKKENTKDSKNDGADIKNSADEHTESKSADIKKNADEHKANRGADDNKQKIRITNEHKETPKKGIIKDVFDKKNNVEMVVLREGSGDGAKKGDMLHVKYVGKLENGKIFDRCTNDHFCFVLGKGEVIKGWDVGLVGMKIGEKRKLTIEPEYGYGKKKIGKIPANSKLIFEVTLELKK
ncbi:peptidylprolyl isomerase fpr3 [Binucleata daphniae]